MVHQSSHKSPSGSTEGDFGAAADHASAAVSLSKHATGKPAKRQKDILAAEFRVALQADGFAFLKQANCFIDRHWRTAHRSMMPVTDERGRICRRETLAALKTWRAAYRADQKAKEERDRQQIALAETLAPHVLPPHRSSLDGAGAVHQMAEDFRTMATRGLGVTARDLRVVGWSREQINQHAEAARRLGYSRENGAAA